MISLFINLSMPSPCELVFCDLTLDRELWPYLSHVTGSCAAGPQEGNPISSISPYSRFFAATDEPKAPVEIQLPIQNKGLIPVG